MSAEENLTDMVTANAERFAHAVSFRRLVDGSWLDVTARDFAAHVRAVARGLISVGFAPGDKIALLCGTRYEWSLLEFACWTVGCVSVPIDPSAPAEQVERIMSQSRAKALVVDSAAHRQVVARVVDRLADLDWVWQLDAEEDVAPAIDELTALGAGVDDTEVDRRRLAVRADDLASIVHTAGVTGPAKAVRQTHRTLLAQARGCLAAVPQLLRPGHSTLLFGAMTQPHLRATALACVYARTTLGHLPDEESLSTDLGTFRPTFLVTVPRTLERVYGLLAGRAHADGNGRVFDLAADVAVRRSQEQVHGVSLRLAHLAATRLVYPRVRGALGGRCIGVLCAGGQLDRRLTHFFRGAGVPVFQGYSLTEAGGFAALETPGNAAVAGSVGMPLPGVAVRVEDDGTILISGDAVAPAEDASGGWLATGDVGRLDHAGYLHVTGREGDTIRTIDGPEVAPGPLEDRLRSHPLVSRCVVVGDQRPFVGALLTVDQDVADLWFGEDRVGLDAALAAAVSAANRGASVRIRRFRVLDEELSETTGELAGGQSPRRDVIAKVRAEEIAALYG
ncbi:AMP-dependent synthetase/ligase [Labedaea rhizosphaerae]|uniref:AMP-dependent synthetase/ligase n=1 Tax=Labedaea rhizosphaerae TaxID=598644 RepID=UPI0010612098|nr:AMP-binding protein [Labedaea rhizosphaerae]